MGRLVGMPTATHMDFDDFEDIKPDEVKQPPRRSILDDARKPAPGNPDCPTHGIHRLRRRNLWDICLRCGEAVTDE